MVDFSNCFLLLEERVSCFKVDFDLVGNLQTRRTGNWEDLNLRVLPSETSQHKYTAYFSFFGEENRPLNGCQGAVNVNLSHLILVKLTNRSKMFFFLV
jgi:hypothetical protein